MVSNGSSSKVVVSKGSHSKGVVSQVDSALLPVGPVWVTGGVVSEG